MPRLEAWAQDPEKEWRWLPKRDPHLPLRVPQPIGKGHPTSSYPFYWAVYGWIDWIDGRSYSRDLDAVTRAAIEAVRGVIDGDAAPAAWERALEAPAWKGTSMWIHADLLRPNVLVRDG